MLLRCLKLPKRMGESFYRGDLADKIAAFSKKYGGFLAKEDLAAFKAEWVKPISTSYRGYDVWGNSA